MLESYALCVVCGCVGCGVGVGMGVDDFLCVFFVYFSIFDIF